MSAWHFHSWPHQSFGFLLDDRLLHFVTLGKISLFEKSWKLMLETEWLKNKGEVVRLSYILEERCRIGLIMSWRLFTLSSFLGSLENRYISTQPKIHSVGLFFFFFFFNQLLLFWPFIRLLFTEICIFSCTQRQTTYRNWSYNLIPLHTLSY